MLVLSRKKGEAIVLGNQVVVRVLRVGHGRVQLGICAPKNMTVYRQELRERITGELAAPGPGTAPDTPPGGAPRSSTADVDLQTRVRDCLLQFGVGGAEQIVVEAYSGEITLRGHLLSAHDKWLCIERCRLVAGVMRVLDELVAPPRDTRQQNVEGEWHSMVERGGESPPACELQPEKDPRG